MPRRQAGSWSILVISLILFCASGRAEPEADKFDVSLDVRVASSIRLAGSLDGTGQLAGVVYNSGQDPGDIHLAATLEHSRVRVLNLPYTDTDVIVGSNGLRQRDPQPQEELSSEPVSGSLALLDVLPNGSFRLLPEDPWNSLELKINGPQSVVLTPQSDWTTTTQPDRGGISVDNRSIYPEGPAASLTGATNFSVSGRTFSLLYGGTVQLIDEGVAQTIETGERFNPDRSITDPTGSLARRWHDRIVVVVEGAGATFTLQSTNPERVQVATRTVDLALDGDASFADVTGDLTVDGKSAKIEPHLLQVIGRVDGTLAANPKEIQSSMSGQATFVGVNGATLAGSRSTPTVPLGLVAATGIALLAAIGAFFTHAGREFLTFITGRNVAEPLSSPARRAFLRAIAATPGITLSQLASQNGFTKWGAMHHMRILRRAHMVDVVRSGNVDTFMLNSGSFRFRVETPQGSIQAASALAVVNHPVRRLIFDALRSQGALHYAQFVEAWRTQGAPRPYPSPSAVTHHASKMEAAGLVSRSREGAHVVWRLAMDLGSVEAHQRRAYRRAPDVDLVLRALAAAPASSVDEIMTRFGKRTWRKPRRRVEETLLMLELSGTIRRDAAERYSVLTQR